MYFSDKFVFLPRKYLFLLCLVSFAQGYINDSEEMKFMNELTKWIADNPVVTTWITLISLLGVLITVIALILQIKDKKRRAIHYTVSYAILVDDEVAKINGIKILFQDKEVSTVAISTIKLWNGGNEILEESNFYPEHELKIVVPQNEKILATAIIEETDDTCKVKILESNRKENEAVISFYCLEPQQGAIINVYHTNVDEQEAKLDGKIKDGKVTNKSIEVGMEDGEMFISTSNYKIYFRNNPFSLCTQLICLYSNILGKSIVTSKKRKKKK